MPGTFNAGFENAHREIGQHALATINLRPRAKVGGGGGGGVIEIALRRGRIVVAFAAEEAADVAPVFAQQRVALVFRMALKKDELGTPFRPRKGVNASRGRSGEQAIARGSQRRFRQIVAARMRNVAPRPW